MNEQEGAEIRDTVARAYGKTVSRPSDSSCCSEPVQKGVVVKLGGYDREELEVPPPDAVVNSFGCGNPLAFGEVKKGDIVLDLGSGAGIDVLIAGQPSFGVT